MSLQRFHWFNVFLLSDRRAGSWRRGLPGGGGHLPGVWGERGAEGLGGKARPLASIAPSVPYLWTLCIPATVSLLLCAPAFEPGVGFVHGTFILFRS